MISIKTANLLVTSILIRDVNCKGAYQDIVLQGLPEINIKYIQLENIQIACDNGMVCRDATVPQNAIQMMKQVVLSNNRFLC